MNMVISQTVTLKASVSICFNAQHPRGPARLGEIAASAELPTTTEYKMLKVTKIRHAGLSRSPGMNHATKPQPTHHFPGGFDPKKTLGIVKHMVFTGISWDNSSWHPQEWLGLWIIWTTHSHVESNSWWFILSIWGCSKLAYPIDWWFIIKFTIKVATHIPYMGYFIRCSSRPVYMISIIFVVALTSMISTKFSWSYVDLNIFSNDLLLFSAFP